jgi:hypothetical protein
MAGGVIVTGAHVIVYINGQIFGRCIDFRPTMSTPSKEIGGIDNIDLIELAPTVTRTSFTMTVWRTIGDGGVEGLGIAPSIAEIQRGKYFSVMLLERVSDTVLFEARWCRVESQSWGFVSKSLTQGTINCKAITSNNEVRALRR